MLDVFSYMGVQCLEGEDMVKETRGILVETLLTFFSAPNTNSARSAPLHQRTRRIPADGPVSVVEGHACTVRLETCTCHWHVCPLEDQ